MLSESGYGLFGGRHTGGASHPTGGGTLFSLNHGIPLDSSVKLSPKATKFLNFFGHPLLFTEFPCGHEFPDRVWTSGAASMAAVERRRVSVTVRKELAGILMIADV